ncbi:MAG: methyl-accepting chemotaxis protein [Chloroflexi bacterium]|nr:methyl-accepting chemotaxis protein [Chloroflexota bacterium]
MKFNVFAKLLSGFAGVLILMGVVGWIGISSMATVNGFVVSMYADDLVPIENLGVVSTSLHRMRVNVAEFLLADDQTKMAEAEAKIAEQDKEISARLDKYGRTDLSKEDKDLLAQFNAAWPAYRAERDNVLRLKHEGKDKEAMTLFQGAARQKLAPVQDTLQHIIEVNVRDAEGNGKSAESVYNQSRMIQIGLLVLATILGLAVALYLSRSISSVVSQMARAAEGIADGNLDQRIDVKSNDEVGQMAKSFTRMIAYLHGMADVASAVAEGDLTKDVKPKSDKDVLGSAFSTMIRNLRELVSQASEAATNVSASSAQLSEAAGQAGAATQQIATTIQEVARGSQTQSATAQDASNSIQQLTQAIDQVAKGAQEQSRAIQETSSSVAKMSAAIDRVSTGSQVVVSSANKSQEAAKSGALAVNHTVQGMEGIRGKVSVSAKLVKELGEHSDQIGKIVETIDDIAEQTNLLALNAAIEAARAGEHGKGFAVVADEVRKLAERAGKATREITQIIQTVQKGTSEAVTAMGEAAKEVEVGSKLSAEAGQALQDILQAVQDSSEQMQGIAKVVSEMNQLSVEVVRSIESVSSVVEENTAATEEMAAGASEVGRTIESVAAVSEQSAASAEEVSAGAEEMSAQVEEVVASAQSLSQMAEELQQAVSRFRLGDDVYEGEPVLRRRRMDWAKQNAAEKVARVGGRVR